MPRIDPKQLLRTLNVLLAPGGGIKSVDEVNRLVQLMQKFSKKLVSKCIYIQILKATTDDLLDKFLAAKGWDLLNSWFNEAIKSNNWPLCSELIQLFAMCPMTANRLKENVEQNQAPKLIRQLTCDSRVDQDIRQMAEQVITKWMAVVQTPLNVGNKLQQETNQNGHVDVDDLLGSPSGRKVKTSAKVHNHRVVSREFVDDEDSDEDMEVNENQVPNRGVETEERAAAAAVSDAATDDDAKPVKLLAGLADQVSQSLKKAQDETDAGDNLKKGKDKTKEKLSKDKGKFLANEDRKSKDRLKDRHKSKEHEERRRKEKEKHREKEKREKKAKPYSQSELRDGLDTSEKERIKMLAQKMKEESLAGRDKKSITAGLGRIPKIKKDEEKKKDDKNTNGKPLKKAGPSFEDLMGAMDSKPAKTVKVPPTKNKNKDLLSTLSDTSSMKPSNKHRHDSSHKRTSSSSLKKDEKESHKHDTHKHDSHKHDSHKHDSHKHDSHKHDSHKHDSNKPDAHKHERPKPDLKLNIHDKRAEKRPSTDSDSPKSKKSSQSIKESPVFGDFLSTIMKDEPKKKKRRLSDIKAEREAKEQSEAAKKEKESSPEAKKEVSTPFSFYRDTMEDEEEKKSSPARETEDEPMDTDHDAAYSPTAADQADDMNENSSQSNCSDNMPFEEPKSTLPREVRGILVYARGPNRKKRSIAWPDDSELVQTEYFEMDETERVNVNKLKFESMRIKEAEMEKAALSKLGKQFGEEPEDHTTWPTKLPIFKVEPHIEYGKESKQREQQIIREGSVLQALFFNNKIPNDPFEPDLEPASSQEPIMIPLEDTSENADDSVTDYSTEGWPEFKQLNVGKPGVPQIDDILSNLQPNLIQNIIGGNPTVHETGNPSIDRALYAAQKAAEEELRRQGIVPAGAGGPPNTALPPPAAHPPVDHQGMDYPFEHPPPQALHGYDPGYDHFDPNGGYPQQHPPPDGWRGRPPHPRGRGGRGGGRPFHHQNDRGRGYDRGGYGGAHDRGYHHDRGYPPRRGHRRENTIPCKFWMQKGFCKEGDRCRFAHL